MDDDQAYLEPGFDPTTLTVPRLRSILVAHNIIYPSSAKKSQLIDQFHEQVAPQASKLRAASLRVKRTSRGIVDIASQNTDGADEEEEFPPPVSTARSSRRTTSRAKTEEPQEVAPTPRSARHSTAPPEGATPRRTSSKHGRPSEKLDSVYEQDVERSAIRRSRPSAVTPRVKVETVDDDSPFSNDNVFQSGSSPIADVRDTERRRTTSAVRDTPRRVVTSSHRKTEDFRASRSQRESDIISSRRTFEIPVSTVKRLKQEEIEPTEEFTPEEEQALVQAEQAGEVVVARRKKSSSPGGVRNGVSVVTIALLAGLAFLWGQEKFQVGYCGVGRHSQEIAGVEVPEWADILRPQCEACPTHASLCEENFQTTCESGFRLVPHPLSLGGKLPLPPTCEADGTIARKVQSVKQKAVEELRTQNAEFECGKAPKPEVKETVLKARVSSQRRRGMTNEEFEALWESALPEIRKVEEVSVGSDETSGESTIRSHSLSRISLGCALRRSLRQTLREYFWYALAVLLTFSGGAYGRARLAGNRRTETRAKQLASAALEKLQLQAALHAHDPNTYRDPYLPMAQLRDDVLRDEFSARTRAKLWEKVQRKVEHNSNVRPAVREGRSGDVARSWEWIGAIGLLENSPGDVSGSSASAVARRKSGNRVSFGGASVIEPVETSSPGPEMKQLKWEEGRQYY